MSSRARERRNRRPVVGAAIIGMLAVLLSGISATAKEPKVDAHGTSTAERLVASARQAEIAGDTEKCYRLLREAVRVSPDFQLARWQLGQMQVDGQWVAVEEAQRRAAGNPKQAQYRELRAQHGETPQGQLALARWCRKNNLNDEARFHWASVLAVDPGNEEALRAIDMRWAGGQLLTREQIVRQKAQQREFKQAAQRWKPKIAGWQRALASDDPAKRESALREIRALTTVEVIPAFEEVTLGPNADNEKKAAGSTDMTLALLDALEKILDPAATTSLVRHAVLSPVPAARASAIGKLKPRPQHEYVPLLLGALAMPLESSFSVVTNGDGCVHYRHSLYREGQDSDWELDTRLSAMQNDLGGRHIIYDVARKSVEVGPLNSARPTEILKAASTTSRYLNRYSNVAAATEQQVSHANQLTEIFNTLLIQALTGATGQNFATPKAWWEWWRNQNEYYASDEHPVDRQYYSGTDSYYRGSPTSEVRYPPPPPQPRRAFGMSCFAKGTLVWTKTGQRQIETLELGDLVLAQNVETGELSYKPLVGRTVRPPSEILNVKLNGEEIRTTLGHPFWVAGTGWRMAKELEDAAILHCVTGSKRVSAVKSSGQEEAYNLVVADFNTYFVGESGVLVHDNTPRTPTRATVPGLAVK
jgi:hypothetical protein